MAILVGIGSACKLQMLSQDIVLCFQHCSLIYVCACVRYTLVVRCSFFHLINVTIVFAFKAFLHVMSVALNSLLFVHLLTVA